MSENKKNGEGSTCLFVVVVSCTSSSQPLQPLPLPDFAECFLPFLRDRKCFKPFACFVPFFEPFLPRARDVTSASITVAATISTRDKMSRSLERTMAVRGGGRWARKAGSEWWTHRAFSMSTLDNDANNSKDLRTTGFAS